VLILTMSLALFKREVQKDPKGGTSSVLEDWVGFLLLRQNAPKLGCRAKSKEKNERVAEMLLGSVVGRLATHAADGLADGRMGTGGGSVIRVWGERRGGEKKRTSGFYYLVQQQSNRHDTDRGGEGG